MSKKLREQYIKQPPRLKDESRVWNPKHGPAFCIRCRSYYDKRSWKHPTRDTWRELSENGKHKVQFVLCPACKTAKEHLFGGEIVIEHIPEEFVFDLLRLIHRFAEQSEARSTEHRLIAIDGNEKQMTVMTTENQLARRLAQKIAESFKKRAFLKAAFSREPYEKEFIRLTFTTKKKELMRKRAHAVKKDRKGTMIRVKRRV